MEGGQVTSDVSMQQTSLSWSFKRFLGLSLTIKLKPTKLNRRIRADFTFQSNGGLASLLSQVTCSVSAYKNLTLP